MKFSDEKFHTIDFLCIVGAYKNPLVVYQTSGKQNRLKNSYKFLNKVCSETSGRLYVVNGTVKKSTEPFRYYEKFCTF